MSEQRPTEETIFIRACSISNLERREAYISDVCGDDPELKKRIEALLSAHSEADTFFATDLPGSSLGEEDPDRTVLSPFPPGKSTPPSERPGDTIGRYKLIEEIGVGGCGVVFRAEQEEPIKRTVALKIIKLGMDTESFIARFEAERQALAMMDHPNIARVLDAGATDRGRPYFVMEHVEGIRITQFCDQEKLNITERIRLFADVCSAIQHAHQKGVIHRDIKPSNILVARQGDKAVAKVIDFGIAKATDHEKQLTDKTIFTRFEQILGTPAYMSPEQAGLGNLDVDTRSDVYSLGVVLYEILTGHPPFCPKMLAESGMDQMLNTIRKSEPSRPSTHLSSYDLTQQEAIAERRQIDISRLRQILKGDLDWIILKALDKDRSRRYATANDLALDLNHFLNNQSVSARPPSPVYLFSKLISRHRFAFIATGLVVVSLLIGLLATTRQATRARKAELAQAKHAADFKEERDRARNAEKRAQDSAMQSIKVAQFLKDTLSSVRPEVALGRDTRLLHEMLDETNVRIGMELSSFPLVEAELRETLSHAYQSLGEDKKSRKNALRALDLRTGLFGEFSPEAAPGWLAYANAFSRGKIDHREQLAENLKRIIVALRETDSPDAGLLGELLHHLGSNLARTGDKAHAIENYRESITLRRDIQKSQSHLAWTYGNLAKALINTDRADEAPALIEESILLREAISPHHPDLAHSHEVRAFYHLALSDLEKAFESFNNAIAVASVSLSSDHPNYRKLLSMQSSVERKLNRKFDPENSMKLVEKARSEMKETGKKLPYINTLIRESQQLYKQRAYSEASQLYKQLLATLKNSRFKKNSNLLISTHYYLGLSLIDSAKDNPQETLNLLSEALPAFETVTRGSHAEFRSSALYYKGTILARLRDLTQAEATFSESKNTEANEAVARRNNAIIKAWNGNLKGHATETKALIATPLKNVGWSRITNKLRAAAVIHNPLLDYHQFLPLVEEARKRFPDSDHFESSLSATEALVHLRSGQSEKASKAISRAISSSHKNRYTKTIVHAISSILHSQKGNQELARKHHQQSTVSLETFWPEHSDSPLSTSWQNEIFAYLLWKEAGTLIGAEAHE